MKCLKDVILRQLIQALMMKIKKHALIRILLNLVFTVLLLLIAVSNNAGRHPVLLVLLYNVLLFVPSWITNFWLFPVLRRDKKIVKFFFSVSIVVLFSSFVSGHYLHWFQQQYPVTGLNDITALGIISSAPDALKAYQFYFDVFPGILIVLFCMAIGYAVQEMVLKIRKEKEIDNEHAVAELRLLKSQISPHFLFNVLNSLYALALEKSEETPDVILKLSDILRYSLYEAQEKEVPVADEVHIINTYIEIERLRIPESARVSFLYKGTGGGYRIAPMLLLPLVENAFKHGTDSTVGSSYIDAELSCNENVLTFVCKNSFKELPAKDVGGIGIQNIRKRLQLLYPQRYRLEIEKNNKEFSVILELKL